MRGHPRYSLRHISLSIRDPPCPKSLSVAIVSSAIVQATTFSLAPETALDSSLNAARLIERLRCSITLTTLTTPTSLFQPSYYFLSG